MTSILDTIGQGYRPGLPLSRREREIILLISMGHSDKDIAEILGCSPRTVQTHVTRIMIKMQAANRCHAACKYITNEPREVLLNLGFVEKEEA